MHAVHQCTHVTKAAAEADRSWCLGRKIYRRRPSSSTPLGSGRADVTYVIHKINVKQINIMRQ